MPRSRPAVRALPRRPERDPAAGSRRVRALATCLLLVLGCAPAVSSPTPPEHGADELSGLRRENRALRRRMQMLEDRILRLEQATLSPEACVKVPAAAAAASSETITNMGQPRPASPHARQ